MQLHSQNIRPNSSGDTIHSVEDHEAESDKSVRHAINGSVMEDIMTGQDGEQEELFCRVCDPVDEDIEDEAEEEAEVQRPLRDPGMPTRREVL